MPLVGVIDLALVGHLKEEAQTHIGAIAIGSMIFNFIYWAFGFLRMGTSGFTAQALGRKNINESFLILFRALLVGFIGSVILLILQKPIDLFSFFILDGSSNVESFAREYFYIRIWAAPATISIYSISGWFIGMQNARIPMLIAIIVNISNIIFSLFFVKIIGMKSDGVALGTLLAQYSGFFIGLFFLLKNKNRIRKYFCLKSVIDTKALKLFFRVNGDIFIRTMSLVFALSFFTAQSAKNGDTLLAVNTLLLQFFTIYAYIIDGFAYAGEALSGKYFGAGNKSSLIKVTKLLFKWGLGISIVFTAIYYFGNSFLLGILTSTHEVINNIQPYLIWVYLIPIASFGAFIWDGIFIGVTASSSMRNAMLISTFIIFIPIYYLFDYYLNNHGLWAAFIIFMISRFITLSFYASKAIFKKLP